MSNERTLESHYLSLFPPSFRKYENETVFRPYIGRNDAWGSISFREVESRLTVAQTHWKATLAPLNLKLQDVIGIWVPGRNIEDLINAIAVSSLGFVPQFFGGYFNNADIIAKLLVKSGGKALIVEPGLADRIPDDGPIKVPRFSPLSYAQLDRLVEKASTDGQKLQFFPLAPAALDEPAALFHSSGTSGALPKVIPTTHRNLRNVISLKYPNAELPYEGEGQVVINTIGNLAHIGSFHSFLGSIYLGQCLAQSSSGAITPEELIGMASVCKLTILLLYATYLSQLIRVAQKDERVKHVLQNLNQIFHTGVALNVEDAVWAYANGLRIIISYVTTETGPTCRSRLGASPSDRLLRPVKGASPVFLPYSGDEKGIADIQLYELVLPPTADDCPAPELRGADGNFHTNDIFEKIEDGWVYRGRAGDWIKLLPGFVDTKNVEDSVRTLGSDLVHDAVVVGSGRKYACLVVEAAQSGLDEDGRRHVAEELVKRLADFNRNLFAHERIEDPKRVIVVEKGTLLRTSEKGNVRRAATEELFADTLDRIAS